MPTTHPPLPTGFDAKEQPTRQKVPAAPLWTQRRVLAPQCQFQGAPWAETGFCHHPPTCRTLPGR